ncbi:hypothetical protein F5146DRAFT_1217828 [Armillaria mellea]|nr:hypothetical protein F5146DRAFT_1217828 [Armillaria mellea]
MMFQIKLTAMALAAVFLFAGQANAIAGRRVQRFEPLLCRTLLCLPGLSRHVPKQQLWRARLCPQLTAAASTDMAE